MLAYTNCVNTEQCRQLRFFLPLGVFEGLKKIVGAKSELSMAPSTEHINDFRSESTTDLSTSPVIRNTLKRKGESDVNIGLSTKKKYCKSINIC